LAISLSDYLNLSTRKKYFMTSVQLHLALTHVPVILSLVGLVMLVVAVLAKKASLKKTSFILIVIAGFATLPVFFSGEGAEEAVEHLPGVSEAIIERHEEVAKLAMISVAVGGMLALAALFTFRWALIARVLSLVVLVSTIFTAGLMVQTAHLGGKIRHTELGNTASIQNEGGKENESQGEDDD
jgi:uncharacterized membrane protein